MLWERLGEVVIVSGLLIWIMLLNGVNVLEDVRLPGENRCIWMSGWGWRVIVHHLWERFRWIEIDQSAFDGNVSAFSHFDTDLDESVTKFPSPGCGSALDIRRIDIAK